MASEGCQQLWTKCGVPKKYLLFLQGMRWLVILAGLWFVIDGWILSVGKYISGKTSVSLLVNETDKFTYPSITFCPGFKADPYNQLKNLLLEKEDVTTNIEGIIRNISYERPDFLKYFRAGMRLINGPLWITSTQSLAYHGTCFTYNSVEHSSPGTEAGLQFGIMYPSDLITREYIKSWLFTSSIFIHDREKFIFYIGQDMPGSTKISLSKLKFGQVNELNVRYSRFTNLNKRDHPCSSDESDLVKCFEEAMAKRRGCQKPWFYFPEFGVRKCKNSSEFFHLQDEEYDESIMSLSERVNLTGCAIPCTSSIYQLDHSYSEDYDKDVAHVTLYFKDFRFQYSEEYLICDRTCLIGEIGGNFGFFLGGSILTLYDHIYYRLRLALLS